MGKCRWLKKVSCMFLVVSVFMLLGLNALANGAVPDVTGMEEQAALATLETAGVSVAPTRSACSNTVPLGHVISQFETVTETGVEATIVLSSGECMITVPDLSGITLEQAENRLERIALIVGAITYQCGGSTDTILGQDPEANSRVAPCSAVNLVVYSGVPCIVIVPDVRGMTESNARAACSAVSLAVSVSSEFNNSVPAGQVIRQSPAAGTEVEENSTVSIVLSLGPAPQPEGEPVQPEGEPTPDPEGEPTPDPEGEPTPDPEGEPTPDPEGEPTPDPEGEPTPDPEGEPTPDPDPPIVLVSVPNITEMTPDDARAALEAVGFEVRIVRRPFSGCSGVPEGEIISQNPAGGTEAPQGSLVTISVARGGIDMSNGLLAAIASVIGLFVFWCLFGCPFPPTIIR